MLKSFLLGAAVMIVVAAAVAHIELITGTIPAGADSGPIPLERWAAKTSLHAALAREAPQRLDPLALSTANLIAGIQLFGEHCAICHGSSRRRLGESRTSRRSDGCASAFLTYRCSSSALLRMSTVSDAWDGLP
ncbi:MAG: hypothetical protein ACREV7_18720 [Steroidobacteraceae bacterium]